MRFLASHLFNLPYLGTMTNSGEVFFFSFLFLTPEEKNNSMLRAFSHSYRTIIFFFFFLEYRCLPFFVYLFYFYLKSHNIPVTIQIKIQKQIHKIQEFLKLSKKKKSNFTFRTQVKGFLFFLDKHMLIPRISSIKIYTVWNSKGKLIQIYLTII